MLLIEMLDIVKDFPGIRALDGVSMTLEVGEIYSYRRERGVESTLMKGNW